LILGFSILVSLTKIKYLSKLPSVIGEVNSRFFRWGEQGLFT